MFQLLESVLLEDERLYNAAIPYRSVWTATKRARYRWEIEEHDDGLRSQDYWRHDFRRYWRARPNLRRGDQGRQDRGRRRGQGQGCRDPRGQGPGSRARLRRYSYALRCAGDVGSHDDDLAVARCDNCRHGQLWIRRGAHASRASRAYHAHARERRRDESQGARDGARLRLAVRELRAIHGYDRAAGHRDQSWRAGRTHADKALRYGRGSDRALGERGRSRGDEGVGASRDGRRRDWLRDVQVAHACGIQRQTRAEPHVGLR